jgi:hypothetical protein
MGAVVGPGACGAAYPDWLSRSSPPFHGSSAS